MILAIDPGNKESAYLLWDGVTIREKGKIPNEELLEKLETLDCIDSAIEMVESFGMAVGKEVFETVFWAGRFFEHMKGNRRKVYRKEIKRHHCHTHRATDANIRTALIDKYGEPGKKATPGLTYGLSGDTWSAFAIATFMTEPKDSD
jgi:hypothetical protein